MQYIKYNKRMKKYLTCSDYIDSYEVIPATIRKCDGIIFEPRVCVHETVMSAQKLINELIRLGYKVYGLRHTETDWSQPRYICPHFCLVNRFGFFATKDEMKFKNKINFGGESVYSDIALSSRNCTYYFMEDGEVSSYNYYQDVYAIPIMEFLNNQDKYFKKG